MKRSKEIGVKEFVMGMAHRGRLSTLTNIFGKPVRELFSEFEGKDFEDKEFDGDVKYHLGLTLEKTYQTGENIKMKFGAKSISFRNCRCCCEGIARAKVDNDYTEMHQKYFQY